MSETTALPSADELLTGVSKHAHGSVDGLADPERKIDWRAVGAGLRHYLPVVSALALAVALVGAGLHRPPRRDVAVTLAPAGVPRPFRRRLLRTR